MAPWSPVFVQVRAGYPTYPTRCQHEGDGKRAGQSTKSLKSPIAPCHCIHVGDSETSPPIHTYISFPTRDIVTYGGYVGFCLLTCTFMGCAREIGRASCRERVWRREARGELEKR